MRRLRWSTLLWVVAAVAAVGLAVTDPWQTSTGASTLVSVGSDSRRVFPGLGDYSLARAVIELQPAAGSVVRLVGGPAGHQVLRGDELLGPADPEAVEGIWASLRMATTIRAVERGVDGRVGRRGTIRVAVSDRSFLVSLGDDTPDGAGIYAEVGEGSSREPWVAESELGWLVDQPAEAWVSRRIAQVDPEEVTGLAWDEQLALKRGEDGIWRVVSGAAPLVLNNAAVNARLGRLLSTRLDPLLPRDGLEGDDWTPWLVVSSGSEGRNHALVLGGNCPDGGDKQQLVDRGPGLVGCIPTSLTEPWAVADPEAGLLESQLVPYAYGRVLSVELLAPERRLLRRRSGGWEIVEGEGRPQEVAEGEVYRWFGALRTLEVEPAVDPELPGVEVEVSIEIDTDSTQRMRIDCGRVGSTRYCRRDAGPFLAVIGSESVGPYFEAETFRDRRLLRLEAGEVVALELRAAAGRGRDAPARLSTHIDGGIWRLDAPVHPDGDAALDEVKLERLLGTLGALRAQSWARVPPGAAPELTLRVDRSAGTGQSAASELALYPGCVVQVDAGRPAEISTAACEILTGDWLYDDPLRAWLSTARSVDIEAVGPGDRGRVTLRRSGGGWVDTEGRAGLPEVDLLATFEDWRSEAVLEGAPPGAPRHLLTVRRDEGADVKIEVGDDWARVVGAEPPWYYRGRTRGAATTLGEP